MFKRFRSGLFFPSEIINYRFEKKIFTILYLVILVLLSTIPSVLGLFWGNALCYSDKKTIRNAFKGLDLPYEIVDYQLIYQGDGEDFLKVELSETLNVIFTTEEDLRFSPFSVDVNIVLTKDKVYFVRSLTVSELFSYSDYPGLRNLDFSGATRDDYDFWTDVFIIANSQLDKYSLQMNLMNIAGLLLVSLFSLLILGVIITSFQKLFNPYNSFGEIFPLMIYALTPHVIGQLLSSLFGLPLFAVAGMIMTVVYSAKLSRKMIQR